MRVLSWINFLMGVWLIAAGFAFSRTTGPVMTEEVALGIIIAVLALVSATGRLNAGISWSVAIAGLWTLIAPAIIRYGLLSTSRTNDVVVGFIVLILGFANAIYRQSPARTTHA